MRVPRPLLVLSLGLLALTLLLGAGDLRSTDAAGLELSDPVADLFVERAPDGSATFVLPGGRRLSPAELAGQIERLQAGRAQRPWLLRAMNVTSTAGLIWLAVGLFGQAIFTGRLLVQWLVSERAGQSTVPEVFWWMSLAGASILLAYFIWRVEPIGILGQGFGWFVYVRNLWLIRVTGRG